MFSLTRSRNVVLAPDVREPGLDVVGVVDVHAAPGQEPEKQRELGDREEQKEGVLDDSWQRVPQDGRHVQQRDDRRVVHDLAGDDADDGDHHRPADERPIRNCIHGESLRFVYRVFAPQTLLTQNWL